MAPGVRSIGFRRVADVHVEVPVVIAGGVDGYQLPDYDARAVRGDVELGEAVRAAVHQAGDVAAGGQLRDGVGHAAREVAVVDRRAAGAADSNSEVEPKMRCLPSAESGFFTSMPAVAPGPGRR